MSQPRRRRRRRRSGGSPSDQQKSSEQQKKPNKQGQQQQPGASSGRRRRRRGRARGEARQAASPKSSEDLVRALPKERPATLTAPPDGQSLEQIVGELQSQYGVPQYPQEYRITIKVADDGRGEPVVQEERNDPDPQKTDGPKREKAPAAPLLMREQGAPSPNRKRKRRGRRRRRGGGGGGNGGNGGGGGNGSAAS